MYGLTMKRSTATTRSRGPAARRSRPRAEVLEGRITPSGSNWSEYNYDASGTRDNTAETTLSSSNVSGLHQLWDFPTSGVVTGTPAVVKNVVYAGDTSGTFYAVSSSGKLLWKTKVNGEVTDSPLVTDNTVIFGTLGNPATLTPGSVYGLDASTGAIRWQVQPDSNPAAQIWGSATLVGRNVAIGVASGDEINPQFVKGPYTARGSLVLLNPENGQIIWKTYTISDADYANGANGAPIWSTPAYDPTTNIIYAGTGNNYSAPATTTSDAMMAFNATNGQILWVNQRTPNDTWTPVFPLGPDADFGDSPHLYQFDGQSIVGEGQKNGFYHALNPTTGAVINQIQVVPGGFLGGLFATAAVDPKTGVVFANGNDSPPPMNPTQGTGDLVAIAGDGSHVLWDFHTPTPNLSGVALANGVVYFVSLNGTMYALDEATGALLDQVNTGGGNSGPAISNGQIYLGQGNLLTGNTSGGIVAFGLSPAQPTRTPYLQTNLVSDLPGQAQIPDSNLVNPWGV
ncbi:MAG: PQQ-binding-like beta-propeller repeat protein, partial [Planctomycetaceae bacterium]|nr:PQQ-binding-like beta-propeller repeat protein [Planctomycetaceae bacterium]